MYSGLLRTWCISDPKKRMTARTNNLNYVVLWNKEDIDKWVEEGFPQRKDF